MEEYTRLGTDLMTTLDKMAEWGEGGAEKTVEERATPKVNPVANQQSMEMLTGMLQGVQGAPVAKPRRAKR